MNDNEFCILLGKRIVEKSRSSNRATVIVELFVKRLQISSNSNQYVRVFGVTNNGIFYNRSCGKVKAQPVKEKAKPQNKLKARD